jgi:hypothetical protein
MSDAHSESGTGDGERPMHQPRLVRLRAALAARDWLGIGIELAVVTLGVLLAFQIDQFGERRAQAKDERQFLGRLYSEYQRGIVELRGVIRQHDKSMREIRLIVAAIDDADQLRRYAETDSFGCDMVRHPSAPFNDSAYEDLVSSGRLNRISDPQLRGEVRDLTTAQGAAKGQQTFGRDLVMLQLSSLDPYYRYQLLPSGTTKCRIDWPGLIQDPRARNAVFRAYRLHQRVSTERQKELAQTERLLGKLACELDKPECRKG